MCSWGPKWNFVIADTREASRKLDSDKNRTQSIEIAPIENYYEQFQQVELRLQFEANEAIQ